MKLKHPQDIIKYPLITESAFNKMDSITENALVFTKHEIKRAFESLYNVNVVKINTLITPQGRKKAFIKLSPDHSALDLATEVGII
ncbi:MAG: 50S ribosomal protein L23 [Candidatus Hodarchaeales archaeon]